MRLTDLRYRAERDSFDLAIRMIGHEARTGTIRVFTGFSEDRIRRILSSYFPTRPANHRRRGKSPSQIGPLISSARRQGEASLVAGLLVHVGAVEVDGTGRALRPDLNPVDLGMRFCEAYEAYLFLHPTPALSFEWAWNLYRSLVTSHELRFAWCALCEGSYVQDSYALDYRRCPFCELKDQR
jgi:hypothetical protein